MKAENMCAVRMAVDDNGFSKPLPHQPVMFDSNNFLWLLNPEMVATATIKWCKHCGALYAEEY